MKTLPVKGCVDYLPKEMEQRQQVIDRILSAYKRNGFLQIKTPVLESLENLTSGDSGDNTKMMFKTIKRGAKLDLTKPNLSEKDIVEEGLRYDLTVPLARLFTGNKDNLPLPFKAIQVEDSFRAEKPQEGRNRQFTQCDVDIWGEPTILGEIEIILTVMEAYKNVGLPNVVCRLSSRKILSSIVLTSGFREEDINEVCIIIDKLEKIGVDGCKNELIKAGFDNSIINNLIQALDEISKNGIDACLKFGADNKDVDDVKNIISTVKQFMPIGYNICFDISIVRGQGYYTGPVYEMYCYDSGYRGAIGGGGRYDNMYKKFAGVDLSAVGYGLGLDSVLLVLNKLNITKLSNAKKLALIYYPENDLQTIIKTKNELKQNYDVSVFPFPKNFKEFMRKISLNGFEYITKIGKDEIDKI